MSAIVRTLRRDAWGLAAALFYFAAGQTFIPLLGIQNDEALFASPIFPPRDGLGLFRVWHTHFALMLMSYLGTLKTLVLLPVVKLFGANPWSVREPMLLAGAASIWMFYLLLRRAVNEHAARIGALLLAADSLYLLTACFDWGPVALQHLLMVAGMLLAVKFHQERRDILLAAAFCAFGLALWDKALFLWLLGALGAATLAVFPRQVLAAWSTRRMTIAAGSLLLGALPLAIYNAGHKLETSRGNFTYDASQIPAKARMLLHTADGAALLGYFNQEDRQTPRPHLPAGFGARASAALSQWSGHPRHGVFPYVVIVALLLAPLAWRCGLRVLLWALMAMTLAWAQMAVTGGAGGSVHHTILLWPLPQIVVAVSFAAVRPRIAAAIAVAIVCVSSLLITNEYHAQMARNGGTPAWTDALPELAHSLASAAMPDGSVVYCMDWGYLDALRLVGRGKLPLREGSEGAARREMVLEMVADPRHIFVTHPQAIAFFPVNDRNLARFADEFGYRREDLARIEDGFGRVMFEVYRFQKAPASSPPETRKRP